MVECTAFDDGQTRRGSARELLEQIRQSPHADLEARGSTVEQYAQTLIQDAEFLIPQSLFPAIQQIPYNSDFDRALTYLANMPGSGVRLLASRQVA